MPSPTPIRFPATVTVALDVAPGRPEDALDLIRRVRAFGEEMRAAGLDVEVTGALSLVVRPRPDDPGMPDHD